MNPGATLIAQTLTKPGPANEAAEHAAAPDAGRPPMSARQTQAVQGLPIDVITWQQTLERVLFWAGRHESRVVAICNAHSVVTARSDALYDAAVRGADMATPDGMPVAWMLRKLGHPEQARINGPDLMWRYCEQAQHVGQSIFLFGNTESTNQTLIEVIRKSFPKLEVAGSISPPFRALSSAEVQADVDQINGSGANIVFVSLGCPKQEKWMAEHHGQINAVMVGVGAAFDYHAGTIERAPAWMQNSGLEWLYRLIKEPRRLWRRYLVTNTLYVIRAAVQLLGQRNSTNSGDNANVSDGQTRV